MRIALVLAVTFAMAPLGAESADLVVWWEKGQYAEEDQALRDIIAAFEQKTGKQVELVLDTHEKLLDDTLAAIEAGRRPPDFMFTVIGISQSDQWAYEGRLVELTDTVGHFSDLFEPYALERATVATGRLASAVFTCYR